MGSVFELSSEGFRADRIILIPTRASRTKAIQWPKEEILLNKLLPRNQPRTGIRNWKNPKWNDKRKIVLESFVYPEEAAANDMAVVSRPSPTARRIISTVFMQSFHVAVKEFVRSIYEFAVRNI